VYFICPQLLLVIFERKKSLWVFIKKGHSYAFPILIKPKGFESSKKTSNACGIDNNKIKVK